MAPRALCGAGLTSAGSTPREVCLTSSLPPLGAQPSWAVHQNPVLTPPSPTAAPAPLLTICMRSLVAPRWRMSSSSTASQLRSPHLHEVGTGQWGWASRARGGRCAEPGRGAAGAQGWGACSGSGAHSLTKCCTSSRLRKQCGPRVTVWTRLSSCWQSLRVMASTLSGARRSGKRVGSTHARRGEAFLGQVSPIGVGPWSRAGRGALGCWLTFLPGRWVPGWPLRGCHCPTDYLSLRPCPGRHSPGKNPESLGCCPAHPSRLRPAQAGVSWLEETVTKGKTFAGLRLAPCPSSREPWTGRPREGPGGWVPRCGQGGRLGSCSRKHQARGDGAEWGTF